MKEKFILMLIAFILAMPMSGQNNQTKRVAILETVDKEGAVPYGVKLMVRSKLCEFITATPGYEGFDRVDIGSILNEHEFQRSGLVSDRDIKRLGEMTGANYVLVAEAAFLNSSSVFLSAKILNVETAKVEQTANVQSPTTVEGLESNCKVLAGRLLNINTETGASRGELMVNQGKYIGEHKNGRPHGRGILYYDSNNKFNIKSYEGDWINGKEEGSGTMIWTTGAKYVGNWKDGSREGHGTITYSDGDKYVGNWENDKYNGFGIYYYSDGNIYEGNFINGRKQGKGTIKHNNGDMVVGYFDNDFLEGIATYYWSDGEYADVVYKKGKYQYQKSKTYTTKN